MENLRKPLLVVVGSYVLIFYLVILLWSGTSLGAGIVAIMGPLLALIFTGTAVYRIEEKKEKRFWMLLFIGYFSYFIGELIYRHHSSFLKIDYQFPGWANFFYNMFVLIYIIAVFYKVYTKERRYHAVKLFVDSFILMTVLITISWIYLLSPELQQSQTPILSAIISLSYLIVYFGMLLGVIMVFFSSRSIIPPVVLVLKTAAISLYMMIEAYYLYQSIYYTYQVSFVTPVWNTCLLLICLSTYYVSAKKEGSPRENKGLLKLSRITFSIIPYLSLTILLILVIIKGEDVLSSIIGGGVVLLLVVVRQVVTILENESLVRQLKKRTEELEIAQLKLLESQERYKSLLDHHPDAIFSIDCTGNIQSSNNSFKKITGYSIEELDSSNVSDRIFKKYTKQTAFHFHRALHGNPVNYELAFKHKNGKRIDLDLTFVPITVNYKTIGVYGIAKDITEKKKTEEVIMKYEKLAVVSRLAAGVAHEIRNPLTTIKGFLQLSYNDKSSLKRDYLDILLAELNKVEMVINEFLYLAYPHHETVFKEVSINNMLQEVITKLKPDTVLNDIKIITKLDSQIPSIECVENQLKQVFFHLIRNAVEATEKNRSVYIEVRKVDDTHICINFQDEGCGISEERLHKLGEPYYSTKEKGTGIGLMVSYKIIEHHKGRILISSKVGKGTTIEVILPISQLIQKNTLIAG